MLTPSLFPSTSRPGSVLLAPPLSHLAATTVTSSLRVHLPSRPAPLLPRPASPPLPAPLLSASSSSRPRPLFQPWLLPPPLFPGPPRPCGLFPSSPSWPALRFAARRFRRRSCDVYGTPEGEPASAFRTMAAVDIRGTMLSFVSCLAAALFGGL